MRTDLKKMNNSLDVILKNASSCVRNDEVDNRVQALSGVELEAMFNISPKYYALLELVARSIETDK